MPSITKEEFVNFMKRVLDAEVGSFDSYHADPNSELISFKVKINKELDTVPFFFASGVFNKSLGTTNKIFTQLNIHKTPVEKKVFTDMNQLEWYVTMNVIPLMT